MSRVIFFGLIVMFMLGILLIAHGYVFHRMTGYFLLQKTVLYWIILGIAALLFPLGTIMYRIIPTDATRTMYTITSAYLGAFFFVFLLVAVSHLIGLLLPLPRVIVGLSILVIAMVLTLAGTYQYTKLEIKQVTIPIRNLQHNVRIVQLSDIHIGNTRPPAYVERIVEKVNQQSPDIVVITGDLVDGTAPLKKGDLDSLNNISAPVIFIFGNHDYYAGVAHVKELLATTKTVILQDSTVTLHHINLTGMDYDDTSHHSRSILPGLSVEPPAVLLNHVPLDFSEAQKAGFDLQLSGHTHNGQIFPLNIVVKLFYKYPTGLSRLNNSWIYVSPGTGTWGPPMRLGSHNEVAVLNLVPA